jgi:hypothetical protein
MAVSLTLTVTIGTTPIGGVQVSLTDLGTPAAGWSPKTLKTSTVGIAGTLPTLKPKWPYRLSFPATIQVDDPAANPVTVASSPSPTTPTLLLQGPQEVYLSLDNATPTQLTINYELAGCLISGTVVRDLKPPAPAGTQGPLANVGVDLVDSTGTMLGHSATDAQGNFCFLSGPTTSGLFTLRFPSEVTDQGDSLTLTQNNVGIYVLLNSQNQLPAQVVYTLATATVNGRVTDGNAGIPGIFVQLFYPKTGQSSTSPPTDAGGYFQFTSVSSGPIELMFPKVTLDTNGNSWELKQGQSGKQAFKVRGNEVTQAQLVVYQPEPHAIVWTVTADGRPAPGKLVEVWDSVGNPVAAGLTGDDGTVTFDLAAGGSYKVVVYPYPGMIGKPIISPISVHSIQRGKTDVPSFEPVPQTPRSADGPGNDNVSDLQSFPVLTQDFSSAGLPSATTPAPAGPSGGTSALALTADKAIREVLSWRTKSEDPKGFVGALNQAFDLKEVEGHTEWTWTPRSYTVQTDMGAVTGAQASIYTRAKVALDQSLPLLDGLYPLLPNVEPEVLATVQAVVRSQFTALVNEFGVVGGPRVPRVDELFELLVGPGTPSNPEEIRAAGSLGLVRRRFGLERRHVTTVDDEQNLTNYLILSDYVIGLKKSWNYDRDFFIRTSMGETKREPFFGTQLVLMSRALEVVTQGVQDAYYTMDSVFIGDAERQTAQLDFANLTIKVPNKKGGPEQTYTFPSNTSGLFVAELLDWVYRAASDELPRLLQDAGKDGLESFKASTDRLRKFVHGAIVPPQAAKGLPPGYRTPRVRRAMQLLADGLDEAYMLAFEIPSPEFPAEFTDQEKRRIRELLKSAKT